MDEHDDPGDFPNGYRDPVGNANVPWVSEYDPQYPDPTPPDDRLADEPTDVEAID